MGSLYSNFKPYKVSENQFLNFDLNLYSKILEIFDPTLKVNNYLSLAGGYTEDADRTRTLVIYPNGMASRVRNWPNSPDLAPGTTLVVPRDPNPFDWLVFSQVLFPIISNSF